MKVAVEKNHQSLRISGQLPCEIFSTKEYDFTRRNNLQHSHYTSSPFFRNKGACHRDFLRFANSPGTRSLSTPDQHPKIITNTKVRIQLLLADIAHKPKTMLIKRVTLHSYYLKTKYKSIDFQVNSLQDLFT